MAKRNGLRPGHRPGPEHEPLLGPGLLRFLDRERERGGGIEEAMPPIGPSCKSAYDSSRDRAAPGSSLSSPRLLLHRQILSLANRIQRMKHLNRFVVVGRRSTSRSWWWSCTGMGEIRKRGEVKAEKWKYVTLRCIVPAQWAEWRGLLREFSSLSRVFQLQEATCRCWLKPRCSIPNSKLNIT